MNLTLNRMWFTSDSTMGCLYIEQIFECYTLELPPLFEGVPNVHDKTCIPSGRYRIILVHSDHFKKMIPLFMHVPNREGIEIHMGNYPKDVKGCILVGKERGLNMVSSSTEALDDLMAKLEPVWKDPNEQIWIEIREGGTKCT